MPQGCSIDSCTDLPASKVLYSTLEHSLGRGHCCHRRHADCRGSEGGGVIHNCQHLPTSTESTNLGELAYYF